MGKSGKRIRIRRRRIGSVRLDELAAQPVLAVVVGVPLPPRRDRPPASFTLTVL